MRINDVIVNTIASAGLTLILAAIFVLVYGMAAAMSIAGVS